MSARTSGTEPGRAPGRTAGGPAGDHVGARGGARGGWRSIVSLPWLALMLLMIACVWGNSLVPGSESGGMSMQVVTGVQDVLRAIGLPSDWVTQFVVRKTAHFTEYLVLALVTMQALRPHRAGGDAAASGSRRTQVVLAIMTAVVLVGVPSIDEGIIQRFLTVGRSSQLRDVLIDCSGAAAGVLLTLLVSHLRRRRAHAGDARG